MLKIANGRVYDPKNRVDGEVRDIYFDNGRIVSGMDGPCETFDASGCAVMAGGIDVHSHIAGEPLELLRDAGNPVVPTVDRLGRDYARMGYTLAANAAMPALAARRTIVEENAIPGLDTANLVWVGENPVLLDLAVNGTDGELDQYVSWLLSVSGARGLKLINPRAGAEDGELPYPRLIDRLLGVCGRLSLPHPLHLHHPFLGQMGAYEAVTRTIERAEGRRMHLAHLQFYGYRHDKGGRMVSAAGELADAVNAHKNITVDVGAVAFGNAAVVTADAGFAKKLARGRSGFRSELWEADGAFGVLPLVYDADNAAGATQFLTGLELMLRIDDPSRVFLTTDHPNGGPFTAYPHLIPLLTDKPFRDEALKKLNPRALSRSAVPSIKREYTLGEIARMTRSGPADLLGFRSKGHLGVGADGGVAVYREREDKEAMFAHAEAVFRGETRVYAAAERPFDAAWVERRVSDMLGVPFAAAGPDKKFFADHRVVREEV